MKGVDARISVEGPARLSLIHRTASSPGSVNSTCRDNPRTEAETAALAY